MCHSDIISLRSISGPHLLNCKLIEAGKLFFVARIVTNDGMSPAVRYIFNFKAKEYFRNPDSVPTGFMGDILRLFKKYDLPLHSFWSITSSLPDLVHNFQDRARLMGNHGLQGGICPLCKSRT